MSKANITLDDTNVNDDDFNNSKANITLDDTYVYYDDFENFENQNGKNDLTKKLTNSNKSIRDEKINDDQIINPEENHTKQNLTDNTDVSSRPQSVLNRNVTSPKASKKDEDYVVDVNYYSNMTSDKPNQNNISKSNDPEHDGSNDPSSNIKQPLKLEKSFILDSNNKDKTLEDNDKKKSFSKSEDNLSSLPSTLRRNSLTSFKEEKLKRINSVHNSILSLFEDSSLVLTKKTDDPLRSESIASRFTAVSNSRKKSKPSKNFYKLMKKWDKKE